MLLDRLLTRFAFLKVHLDELNLADQGLLLTVYLIHLLEQFSLTLIVLVEADVHDLPKFRVFESIQFFLIGLTLFNLLLDSFVQNGLNVVPKPGLQHEILATILIVIRQVAQSDAEVSHLHIPLVEDLDVLYGPLLKQVEEENGYQQSDHIDN